MIELLIILENTLTALYFFKEYYYKKKQKHKYIKEYNKYLRDNKDTEEIINKCRNIYYLNIHLYLI